MVDSTNVLAYLAFFGFIWFLVSSGLSGMETPDEFPEYESSTVGSVDVTAVGEYVAELGLWIGGFGASNPYVSAVITLFAIGFAVVIYELLPFTGN